MQRDFFVANGPRRQFRRPLEQLRPQVGLMAAIAQSLGAQLGSSAVRYASPLASVATRWGVRRGADGPASSAWERRTVRGAREAAGMGDVAELDELTRVEAALFLAHEPLSTRKLAKLAGLADGTKARSLVKELAGRLAARGSALEPVEVAGGVQLLTRPQLAGWLQRQRGPSEELRFSAPALETLAVVAYRQPVLRADVEGVRGVQCGEILRVLMERDLLRIVGRSEELGRPFLYGTTRKFLRIFGLQRLEQLPPIDQTRSAESHTADRT